MFDICIHHHPCADGFTAAWAIWTKWPHIDFVPGVYGAPPPDVAGKHVLIVDFSYKLPVLREMAESALSITILDHHKSAEADLAGYRRAELLTPDQLAARGELLGSGHRVQALFNMDKSGATLAWEFAYPDADAWPAPDLVRYVEDRDLWRFAMEGSREVAANLFSFDYEFATWSECARRLEQPHLAAQFVAEGIAIERKHMKDVRELLRICTREMVIGGHRVQVANMPYTLSSDGAGALAEGQPFGACYYDNAEGKRVFSLRSRDGGVDVSEIAVGYGGGGHAKAAGFTAAPGWEGDAC